MKLRTILGVMILFGANQVVYGMNVRVLKAAKSMHKAGTVLRKGLSDFTPGFIVVSLIGVIGYKRATSTAAPLPTQEEINKRSLFYKTVSER